MSINQSIAEKSEYRKFGRSGSSGQPRNFSDSGCKGGGSGGRPTLPPSSSSLPMSSNQSFKKSNYAQGGESRVSSVSVNSDTNSTSAARAVQNGAPLQPPLQDLYVSRSCPLQFGSISPQFMNAMQARHDSFRAVPTLPILFTSKQQLPKINVGDVDQSNTGEPHAKRDVQAQPTYMCSQGITATSVPLPMQMMPLHIGNHQVPQQVMHKAENKYEVGRVTDAEEAKQRQLKAILNKLIPQNFERLFEQVKAVNIDNAVTLTGVVSQLFHKALMEPNFCEMYVNIFYHLAGELPGFTANNEKITFKRLLLNKCQEEFQKREREQEEANIADKEGEIKQPDQEREEQRTQARRRMLANIRLIGELYKKKMLTERIMHECIKKLLGRQYQSPDEEDIEALCKLMNTIGEMIDHPKSKVYMNAYFDTMAKLSNNMNLSSRVRFMLKDAIDLRKNRWQHRRKVEGPKRIKEVHRNASRLARGPGIISSVRRGQPMDFNQRSPNMLSSPNTQMGSFKGPPAQLRGYGTQDARLEKRHFFENTNFSVPLTHRPLGDESITLGTQGGLARGMSFRGQPSVRNISLADVPSPGDSRRRTIGLNAYNPVSERTAYGPREDLTLRYIPERKVSAAYDQSSMQDRSRKYENRDPQNADRSANRSLPTSPPTRVWQPILTQNDSSEKLLTEERLRDMSLAAIKEFYSARDEKEVALCIKDLNAPSFYPSMISIWVTDSFERNDMERDLLAELLNNLTKSQDIILRQDQLIKGFEAVLTTLEDAVNDAPKAAEFLGSIFAKIVLHNLIPFTEIVQLVYEGGEEHGHLVEIGLAAKVVGSFLEQIKSEKGDSAVNEIRTSMQEQSRNYGNRDPRNADRNTDRSLPTSPPTGVLGPILTQNDSSVKLLTEERLRDMSLAAIKEFYSARDEKEVALCIRDLNAPSFYPSMISMWVTDSFERNDMERDLLAELLINLTKSQDITLRQEQLIKGFEAVLTTLEDAVNDAPKAAEFLGRIFAKIVLHNLIPFTQIVQLVYEGGEEQGRLVEIGLAAKVVGSFLELIKSEKGDSAVNEIRTSMQEQSTNFWNRDPRNADRSTDRSLPTSPPTRVLGPILTQNDSSVKLLTEERLRDISLAAIKEFYSARDEKEVALCIKDLNAPSFYPSMISIWVTDSFERNDMERDLLAKLLINLTESQDIILHQDHLVKGFEAVLTTLEDAINDAPKAAEFLGRIFAKVVLDNLIPFTDIAHLVYEGGEEQGRLVEIGLAAEVVGTVLELIKSEKGDSAVYQICTTSTLQLENFRPPNRNKSLMLDKFI